MTLTIRQRLEAIRNRNDYPTPWHKRNEDDYEDAVAALEALDEADVKHYQDEPRYRLVADPAPPTENT